MHGKTLFLLAGAAIGAGVVMLLDRARDIEEIRRSSRETLARPRELRGMGIESTAAGFEAMDEDDLETPYSGYSGT